MNMTSKGGPKTLERYMTIMTHGIRPKLAKIQEAKTAHIGYFVATFSTINAIVAMTLRSERGTCRISGQR